MATWAETIGEVANDIGKNGLEAEIRRALSNSIEFYQNMHFWFNEEDSTSLTIPWDGEQETLIDSESLPLPVDFMDFVWLEVDDDPLGNPLLFSLLQEEPRVLGKPHAFSLYRQRFYFRDIPDKQYRCRLWYYKEIPVPQTDDTENEWTREAKSMIQQRAKHHLWTDTIRRPALAQAAQMLEFQIYAQFQSRTDRYQSTGNVKRRAF